MATPPNQLTSQEQELREQVRMLDEQALKWKNILNLRREIKKAAKEENFYNELSAKLSAEERANAQRYAAVAADIQQLEKDIQQQRERGTVAGDRAAKSLERTLRNRQAMQRDLLKTEGGLVEAQSQAAVRRKGQLEAERNLIRDINKQRGIGSKIMDLFRSKEERQRQIDLARARAGGGANLPPGTGGGGAGGEGGTDDAAAAAAAGGGPWAALAAKLTAAVEKIKASFKEMGGVIKSALVAPFASAASLLTGEDFGMGGGAVKATGASSLLGGIEKFASAIPFVGGLLGGLVGIFKTLAEAVLGVDQANFRVARNLNISVGAAERMRKSFDGIAGASNSIVVNSTRLLQSQAEISSYLGTNKQLSASILENDTKLRDILGMEAESRKAIAESALASGRNAAKLTQGIIGTVLSFNKAVGTSFKFNDIMKETAKLSGVMGLTFAKYPEKITKAVLATKTLGFELNQLDSTAESFLDFENSISKEMEAQVLTGKAMNLTAAREAALNNDNVALAREITKNVGSTADFLGMNRIQQEAIANAVGMTRNSLADVLKKQELYSKLGATDVETFNQKIALLEKQGKTQEQISALIGKDAYNTYTQVSTAEKLTEIMEKIKKVFVDFVKNSGLFDFLTNPEKMNRFIVSLTDKLASTISLISEIIATMLDGVGSLPFTDTEKWQSLAAQVRAGGSGLSGALRSTSASLGGTAAPSISGTVQKGTRAGAMSGTATAPAPTGATGDQSTTVYLMLDGEIVTKQVVNKTSSSPYSKPIR